MTTFTPKAKRIVLAAIFLLLLMIAYEFTRDHPSDTVDPQNTPSVNLEKQKQEHDLPAPMSDEMLPASAPVSELAPANSAAANTTANKTAASAWVISYESQPSMAVPEGIVEYEPVTIDMESPAYPSPGQQVSLGLTGGEVVSATVKTGNQNPNGDYSWRGYLDGHGTQYPVVMTYGANTVFATITTPKGSYTLESIGGSGWIYKNPSEFELSEPGKKDFLEVPGTHDHSHNH